MKKVAIYVRSSKDLHNVSCEAQEDQIRKVVRDRGEQVYQVFRDIAKSSTRDVRPEFGEMIELATSKQPPFQKIYCLDTSRFGRDQLQTQTYLSLLRDRHGIEVDFLNMPSTGTSIDPLVEGFMTNIDAYHSRVSKERGVAGMKQNVKNGYRAGGKAPYGYKLKKIPYGKHPKGGMITKSVLEPHPEHSINIKEYFERRAKFESVRSILKDFYNRGILSPSGNKRWSVHTAKAIENNLDVYLGHTIFNKINERIKINGKISGYKQGKKTKPREEWVITENTHEPLITEETADIIRKTNKRKVRETPVDAKNVYTLSGIIKCSECGTNYTGDRKVYKCNSKTKLGKRCPNNDISQKMLEGAVFTTLGQKVFNIHNVKDFIARVQNRFQRGKSKVQPLEKQLDKIENQIRRVMKLYRMEVINDDVIEAELVPLQEQKGAILKSIEAAKSNQHPLEVSEDVIMDVVEHFKGYVSHSAPEIRKSAVSALIQEIIITPKKGHPWERLLEVKGVYLPLTGRNILTRKGGYPPLTRVNVASPRGFEPLLPA